MGTLAFGGAMALGLGSASADSYTVKSGDTLNAIAQEHNTTAQQLGEDNRIDNINLIYVGDVLYINEGQVPAKSTPAVTAPVTPVVPVQPKAPVVVPQAPIQQAPSVTSGSVHDRFIASGGTEAMWSVIVMPESGGNPNITSPNGYHGLGQTKQSWGYGSVETQTQGMVNYANSRYGSIGNAIAFRQANNWW